MKKISLIYTVLIAALLWATQGHALGAGPTVRVMPDGIDTPTKHTAYTWAGNSLVVWGNVEWGSVSAGSYVWDFGDGSGVATGAVTNAKDIAASHTYLAAGTYFAKLTVTDTAAQAGSAQVRIDVLAVPNDQARINLAIERGLKWQYLAQLPGGYWNMSGYVVAPTALSVLAFENWGHQPVSPASDIYRNTVTNGLNFLFQQLEYRTYMPNWQSVDVNANGYILGIPQEEYYPHGMMMMALAASGGYDKNYPKTDAVHNPALNLLVPASVPNIGGQRYYDVLEDMMEYAAWGQADPGTWGRGGFRYSPNSGEGDNSVGQWPVIGLEAAENWGIVAPAWVKSELKTYWLHYSYNLSTHGWGYTDTTYDTVSHSGAGLSMMAYVGIPKTDPWAVDAWNALAANWAGSTTHWQVVTYEGYWWPWWPSHFGNTSYGDLFNSYAMYGVAKAARIARDSSGNVSQVVTFGSSPLVDWYHDYCAYLLPKQQADGSWPGYWYWDTPISTPFALLILEPTVSSLRPVAAISASPNPVHALTQVNFDISGSTHQDPAKFLVSWKLIFDDTSVNWASPDASGVFPISGTIPKTGGYPQKGVDYDVSAIVQVTDNVGTTAEAVTTVHITSGLVPPVANPGGPYFGSVNGPIILNGSGSSDINVGGSIVKYEWDLDGNGTYETNAGASPTLPHTWTTPYTGQIGLKVTDNFGLSSTASVYTQITVSDLHPVSYPLVSVKRLSATVWEYEYRFVIQNTGTGGASGVQATLQNWPAQVTVLDDSVTFGNVAAGATVTSVDTFKIRINRTVAVKNNDLTWRLDFTDAGGHVWTLLNFPLF